jgi:iron(III) transport system permease protein
VRQLKSNKKFFSLWNISTLVILLLFLTFIAFPLFLVLQKSVIDSGGGFTLDYLFKFFEKKYYWITILNSFKVTIVTTALSVILGLPLAYMLRRVKIRGNKII